MGMVWVRALSLGLGCESLWLHSPLVGGNAQQGGKALGLFHFPDFVFRFSCPELHTEYTLCTTVHNNISFQLHSNGNAFPSLEHCSDLSASLPDGRPALPQALLLSFQASPCRRSQLTIARTIRIFRGIMTGLVKHSCP